jgi:prevent-host-death family protein
MKTITIRELHANTGDWLRQAADHGEILVTDRGQPIAKIIPETGPPKTPYFANRKVLPEFAAFEKRAIGRRFTVDRAISEDRKDRV